jgi:hypothetical protein
MQALLAQQDDENRHQGGTRECDEVTRRASIVRPRLSSQHAQAMAVAHARSAFVELGFSWVRGVLAPRSKGRQLRVTRIQFLCSVLSQLFFEGVIESNTLGNCGASLKSARELRQ